MSMAIAYNQSDICQRFKERVAVAMPQLLRSIEIFDYDSCEESASAIEAFISQCLSSLEILATIALALARDNEPVPEDLIEWLFNLSRIIDSKILASPQFESIASDKKTKLESAAADLAYATSIIDLNNCKEINNILASKGYLENA